MNNPKVATLVTLALSLVGGLIAQALHMPAALLVGGAILVSIASLSGVKTGIPNPLRDTAFVIVGMTLGTNVAQDSLSLLPQWPVTLIGLVVALVVIVALTTLTLHLIFGFDWGTSYLSSFPGHLSFVLGIAESGYGNSREIAVIQSMRVILLTAFVPIVARFHSTSDLSVMVQTDVLDWVSVIALAAACTAGGFVFKFLKLPASFVLGSMVVATAGKLMGLYDGHLPIFITLFGYLVMGGLIGSRFSGATLKGLGRMAVGGLAGTAICVGVVSAISYFAALYVHLPFGQIWLGLAPGALEAMGAMGIALGYDTAFIAAHHTARFFLLTMAIPTVAALGLKKNMDGK